MQRIPLLAAFCALGSAFADDLNLTDTRGRSIEVVIKSADDVEVVGIRKSDRREIKLPLATLNAASRAAVVEWRKKVGRMPTEHQAFTLQGSKRDYMLNLSLKLPSGKYNSMVHMSNRAKVLFENGEIMILPSVADHKLEQVAASADRIVEGWTRTMTPSERELFEPTMKPKAVSMGEYNGFEVLNQKRGSYCCILIGKGCRFEAWLNFKEGSPIMPEDMKAILATVHIEEKKKPLAERR